MFWKYTIFRPRSPLKNKQPLAQLLTLNIQQTLRWW